MTKLNPQLVVLLYILTYCCELDRVILYTQFTIKIMKVLPHRVTIKSLQVKIPIKRQNEYSNKQHTSLKTI